MKPSRRKRLFSLAILCVLVYSFLFGTSLALADEPTPPVSTEETTPPPVDEQPDEPDPEGQPPVDEPSDPAESDEEFLASEESDELPAETVEETPTTVPDKAGESTDDAPDGDEEADDEPGLLDSLPADTSVVVVVDGQLVTVNLGSSHPGLRANILLMFQLIVTRFHSPLTLSKPRSRNWSKRFC